MPKEGTSRTAYGEQPINEIRRRVRNIYGLPPQLGRRSRARRLIELADKALIAGNPRVEWFMSNRGLYTVQPTASEESAKHIKFQEHYEQKP